MVSPLMLVTVASRSGFAFSSVMGGISVGTSHGALVVEASGAVSLLFLGKPRAGWTVLVVVHVKALVTGVPGRNADAKRASGTVENRMERSCQIGRAHV